MSEPRDGVPEKFELNMRVYASTPVTFLYFTQVNWSSDVARVEPVVVIRQFTPSQQRLAWLGFDVGSNRVAMVHVSAGHTLTGNDTVIRGPAAVAAHTAYRMGAGPEYWDPDQAAPYVL